VDLSAWYGKGGQCRSGLISMVWQGWTMQEWTYQHGMARVDSAGVDNAGVGNLNTYAHSSLKQTFSPE